MSSRIALEHRPLVDRRPSTLSAVEALDVARGRTPPASAAPRAARRRPPRGACRRRARRRAARRRRRRRGTDPTRRTRCRRGVASGTKSLMQRDAVVGALAEADRAHLRERADRLAHPALGELDAGDERGRDRAQADGEHAEAALDGLHHGGLERLAISCGHVGSVGVGVRTRCCTKAPCSTGTARRRARPRPPCARPPDRRGRASPRSRPRATPHRGPKPTA